MISINTMKLVTIFGLMLVIASTAMAEQTVDTRIGKLEFTSDWKKGYHADEALTKLSAEMDFQRAVQACIWAIPFVSQAQTHHMQMKQNEARTQTHGNRESLRRRHSYRTTDSDTFNAIA